MYAKKRNMLAIAGTLVLLSGCISPSVNPLYTDNDLVFDPLLVGVWVEDSTQPTDENWTFEKGPGKSYKLTITGDHEEKGEFEAHLLKLKDYFFLDLKPSQVKLDPTQVDVTDWALIRGHLILRVYELDSKLKVGSIVAGFDPGSDWLNEYLRKNPNALAHVNEGDRVKFITASTQDLQQFVLAHLGKNELFEEPGVAVRRPAGAR